MNDQNRIAVRRMNAGTVKTLVLLLAVGVVAAPLAACGSDSDKSLDGFMVTSATVGGELADAVSGDEASCLEETIGDSAYQAFRAAPLAESGRDTANMRAVYDCLTEDNFLIYVVGVSLVWSGGWSAETEACIIAVAREQPEFVYIQIGLEEEVTTAREAHVYLLDYVNCLNDEEKIAFTQRTFSGPETLDPSALLEILAFIPTAEAACLLDAVGVTPEQLPQRIQADAGGGFVNELLSAVPTCISEETSINIFVADTGKVLGGLSDQSQTCLKAFGMENYHFFELVAGGQAAAQAMPAAAVAAIVDDGLRMVECFNDDELLALQRLITARVLRQP
ncbi:MAG: hypothetical protein OXE02_06760 [Chloroflexi bacterium]|nr:hypothetical protein [Chloroflexota bacterium]